MTTETQARRTAESMLDLDKYVITTMREFDVGWVYFYDSRRHQETGAISDLLGGNSPILVDREDGSAHHTGTARTIEDYIERYKSRDSMNERSWHP